MNQELCLKILSDVMGWADDRAREEFRWLRLMARLKYDGYRDFHAGMRFLECLITWLQQFGKKSDRETAYAFIKSGLVYIGPGELLRLVEQFFPNEIWPRISRMAAAQAGVPPYRCLADPKAQEQLKKLQRQTLVMGLSDGARIDILRHANVGILSNEQFALFTQLDTDKWEDLLDNLRKDLNDKEAKFSLVCLVDDFMGTGSSFLRYNNEKKKWSGKLVRFKESVADAIKGLKQSPFADNWELCIHHYIGTASADSSMPTTESTAAKELGESWWAKSVRFSFGTVLPADMPINNAGGRFDKFIAVADSHYDPSVETKHTAVGGVPRIHLGYGGCALPLVLEHNTPNNSVALLWAETKGDEKNGVHRMRPLFRRRQRHT